MAEPRRMIPVSEALALILDGLEPLETIFAEVHPDGHLDATLEGRPALAETLHARWSLPTHDTAIMDGFALRCADLHHEDGLAIQGESAAGHPAATHLAPGHAMPISTGAVIPDQADLVVPIEDCERLGDRVRFNEDARARGRVGRFIRPAGSDVRADSLLLEAGTSLGPAELPLLVAGGHHRIPIVRPPRVAILATGDELLPPGAVPERGQLIETNSMMLQALSRETGAQVHSVGRVGDTRRATLDSIREAAGADLLLTTGGISVGVHDHVGPALRELGFELAFEKVQLRPGKPTTFGRLGGCRVLALPGNPASSYVAFELFARPLLRRLGGHAQLQRPRARVPLATKLEAEERRDHYLRARIVDGKAEPLPTQLSGALTSIAAAEVLLLLPGGSGEYAAGDEVEAIILNPERFSL